MKELLRKKGVRAGLLAIVLIVVVGIAGLNVRSAQRRKEYNGHVEAAEKYLTELDYEQAIAEYTLALEIEPKSEEVLNTLEQIYLDYAQSLVDARDYKKAVSVLEEGYVQTGRESLRDKIWKVAEEAFGKINTTKSGRQHISDERLEGFLDWTIQIIESYGDNKYPANKYLANLYYWAGEHELSSKKFMQHWEQYGEHEIKEIDNNYKIEDGFYIFNSESDSTRTEWVTNQYGFSLFIKETVLEDGSVREQMHEYDKDGRLVKVLTTCEYNSRVGEEKLFGTDELESYHTSEQQEIYYEYDSLGKIEKCEITHWTSFEDGDIEENNSQAIYTYHDENRFTVRRTYENSINGTVTSAPEYYEDYEIINELGEYRQIGESY